MSKKYLQKPLLIYDGDCNFCRRWVARWQYVTEEQVDYASSQEVSEDFPQIPKEKFAASVQLVLPDGKIFSGAHAVFQALAFAPKKGLWLWLYKKLPGFAWASEFFYSLVARHRVFFSKLTNLFWGKVLEPPTYHLSRWLFLRFLGIIYLIAFVSLAVQMDGLIGSEGILPAGEFLKAVSERFPILNGFGVEKYRLFPTLCWWDASDSFLKFLCWGGAGFALFLVLDLAPLFALLLCWIFYLSLTTVSRDFLWFQWDILLLETGFLAIFFAPLKVFPGWKRESHPPFAILWLLRWLLFRLMFQSGIVKLLSGDTSWLDLTALTVHYETQPLPTWIGYYAHQFPEWFQKFSCGAMFGIELLLPFLIFFPRRVRLLPFFGFLILMILIFLTGNYNFFNLLTVVLCILLLDDQALSHLHLSCLTPFYSPLMVRQAQSSTQAHSKSNPERSRGRVRGSERNFLKASVITLVFIFIFSLSLIQLHFMFARRGIGNLPEFSRKILAWVQPFHFVNSYGLFSVMTKDRSEIIIEGSNDGQKWLEYEFKWKPGDLKQKPKFVVPHQPRLDWQMWFAALSNYQNNPWFVNLLVRLLQGSQPVTDLFKTNPFPEQPPKYLRALLYGYRFTDLKTKKKEGLWWRRELKGLYSPIATFQQSRK